MGFGKSKSKQTSTPKFGTIPETGILESPDAVKLLEQFFNPTFERITGATPPTGEFNLDSNVLDLISKQAFEGASGEFARRGLGTPSPVEVENRAFGDISSIINQQLDRQANIFGGQQNVLASIMPILLELAQAGQRTPFAGQEQRGKSSAFNIKFQ